MGQEVVGPFREGASSDPGRHAEAPEGSDSVTVGAPSEDKAAVKQGPCLPPGTPTDVRCHTRRAF